MDDEPQSESRLEMYREIIKCLTTAPVSQVPEQVRREIREFSWIDYTEVEAYEFLDKISQKPCPYEISSFVQSLCDVTKHYPRPNEQADD